MQLPQFFLSACTVPHGLVLLPSISADAPLHHGVGSPVVVDISSMFADPGVETMSRFTKVYLSASAAEYAIYIAVGVVCGLLSASYYFMYLFNGYADDFHFTAKVPADRLGNVSYRSY